MTEIPEPGTGSVSLNMATEASNEPTTTTTPVTEPTPTEPTKEGEAIAIPVLDDEEDSVEVADLKVNSDGSLSIFQQKNVKLWGAILGGALIVLIGVFFFLARQTSLFQGSLQFGLEGDEVVITDPNFDSSSEGNLTPTGGNDLPDDINDDPLVLPTGESPNNDAPILGDDFDSILDQFEDGNDPFTNDDIIIGDNGDPVVPDADPTQDPEFNDDILVDIPNDSSDITPTPNPMPMPDPTPTPVVTTPPASQTDTNSPSLISNTNPDVLGSAEVQGNTGPGVLIYFLPPFAAYMIRRKNVR